MILELIIKHISIGGVDWKGLKFWGRISKFWRFFWQGWTFEHIKCSQISFDFDVL